MLNFIRMGMTDRKIKPKVFKSRHQVWASYFSFCLTSKMQEVEAAKKWCSCSPLQKTSKSSSFVTSPKNQAQTVSDRPLKIKGLFKFYFILALEIFWQVAIGTRTQEFLTVCRVPSSEWLHTAENSKCVLSRLISRDCLTQNTTTWESGLWVFHSRMMPLTPYWFMLFFPVLFLPMNIRAGAANGVQGRQGKKTGSFLPRKGVFFAGRWEEFGILELLVGLWRDAEHSLPLLPMASCLPAVPGSLGLRVQIPRGETLVSSWEGPQVSVSHAGLGFDPRKQRLSIKNETQLDPASGALHSMGNMS